MKKSQSSDYINGLDKTLGIDKEGNLTVRKNLQVDGNVFTLNGKHWGIMPVYTTIDNNTSERGFIIYSDRPGPYSPAPGVNMYYIKGIYADNYGDVSILSVSTNKTDWYSVENDILYIKNQEAYNNFQKETINLGIEKQNKLFVHILTLTAGSTSYTLLYQATNDLKVNSIAGLRTITNVKNTADNVILPVCLNDLTGTAALQITTSLCKIGSIDVTAVSDKVTAL